MAKTKLERLIARRAEQRNHAITFAKLGRTDLAALHYDKADQLTRQINALERAIRRTE